MFYKALVCFVISWPLIFTGNSWADPSSTSICDMAQYRGTAIYNKYCGSSGSGGNSNYDYGAAQRAQEAAAAAAEAQRQRDAELEQQRIDADNKRREEEIANQAKFIKDRDAAVSTLRGSTGSTTSGGSGLRGSSMSVDQDATVLKGAGSFGSDVVKLKGIESAEPPILNGSASDPGSQLKTTEYHGTTARGGSADVAHSQAGKGFDTLGEDRGTQAVRPKKPDRSTSALAAKIPPQAWSKDPQIGQLYGYYENLGAIKAEALSNIADIKRRQKDAKEDPAVLSAQLSSLNKKLKDTDRDQVKTEKTIKEHVARLGLDWNEGGTDAANAPKTGDKK